LIKLGLFSRFFALFGITTILLGICIALGANMFSERSAKNMVEERHDNLVKLLTKIHTKGDSLKQLNKYAGDIKGDILRIQNDQRLVTNEKFPTIKTLLEDAEAIGQFNFAKYKGNYYLMLKTENGWLVATSNVLSFVIAPWWAVLWPWFAIVFLLALSYFVLRRLLSPIFVAVNSVKAISEGNFEHTITKHPKNELAELTRGVNKMAAELKSMFDAKNELLLAISHELRTPLARMQISLAMMEKTNESNEIKSDLKHMDLLIGQLLEGERLESGHKSLHLNTIYLPILTEEILTEESLNGVVTLVNPAPEIAVVVDVGRIKFLLRNLLLNSLKHNDENVCVSLAFEQHNNMLTIAVKDTGSGIPEHALPQLFDPFYCVDNTTNRGVKGTGLGLYLCKKIAQAHGGELVVESQLGEGSCFTFSLPINDN